MRRPRYMHCDSKKRLKDRIASWCATRHGWVTARDIAESVGQSDVLLVERLVDELVTVGILIRMKDKPPKPQEKKGASA